ncbi:PD-(D/E)XK nuclease family protein [Candidatus Woesearchaeota archaeon]|nr:PD-(D/E)XK nuclease family protein [Candidatus Woesearchaeota archaeon]
MVISHTALDHKGGRYFYRLHNLKIANLCQNYPKLKDYLYDMLKNCPNNYFNEGPRSSTLKFNLENLNQKYISNHETGSLTKFGLEENAKRYKTSHSKVQVFMLENDFKTIAVEIPIWLSPTELECYQELFNSEKPLTGHIDLLRIEDDKIWVFDYKPNAEKEKFASTQIYFYALMLSKRTGIPLENFRCAYFDQNHCYAFKPEDISLKQPIKITEFCK